MKTIRVEFRTVYGKPVVYPACPDARIFADMLGTKTLTPEALGKIRLLGYHVDVVHPTVTLAA